ncbi:BLUE MICROPYLAR END 3-ZINC FINGER, GATA TRANSCRIPTION FACTOR 8, BLUE MICROPYLAR END 3 [Hibiscus trionum]|nr:BLUE MICROPYLAR END 3-ZINC FINGER, GATA TRANSCRIPTION FACTOR 8, BLUE MICROPYLAR END 3 [Hibiscus trionum]
MIGSADCTDEIDCGSFFDDLVDFPNGDVELEAFDSAAAFPSIWTTHHESLPCSDSVFSHNSASDPSTELFVPYEDIVQLEWNKRPRSATFNHLPGLQPISPTSSVGDSDIPHPFAVPKAPLDSENYAESRLLIKLPKQVNPEHKKKKKIKLSLSAHAAVADNSRNPTGQAVRMCMHCEITKTPQWRAGPMGPKTLCNACGVRYKSGRLFPEYRPAASPTFLPSLHSNSHKKVLEMRTKSFALAPTTTMIDNNLPELIPNKSNPALDCI